MAKFSNIDDYISHLPADVQAQAAALRATIKNCAPSLTEAIRYDMPAFKSGDATIIYFAFWKANVGLYPIYRGTEAFEAEIQPYRAKTDAVQFSLKRPIPLDLVEKIVASQLNRSRA